MSKDEPPAKTGRPSILPFDPADMTTMRVNQAGLARMLDCSRQAVSEWVKSGKISTFPDGSIDPQRAYQEYLANSDPSRMQHKMLKPIAGQLEELRKINHDLAIQKRGMHEGMQRALQLLAEQAAWLERFAALVEDGADTLRAADAEEWEVSVQLMFDAAGEHALDIDPGEALPRIDESLAAFWQPA